MDIEDEAMTVPAAAPNAKDAGSSSNENGSSAEPGLIKVYCRLRPQNSLERREGATQW